MVNVLWHFWLSLQLLTDACSWSIFSAAAATPDVAVTPPALGSSGYIFSQT